MHNTVRESINRANDSSVALLFTDLELAQTILHRAELSADLETRQRNLDHVAKACESIRHFMGKLRLSIDERRILTERLDALETRVRVLRAGANGALKPAR